MKFVSQLFVFLLILASSPLYSYAGSFLNDNSSLGSLMPSAEEEPEFLPVDQAFEFNFIKQGDNLILTWLVAPEYYLYRDKIKFAAIGVSIGDIEYPHSVTIEDEYFGTSHIYREQLTLTVPLKDIEAHGEIKVRYQGCADAGLCYPPVKQVMPLIATNTATMA